MTSHDNCSLWFSTKARSTSKPWLSVSVSVRHSSSTRSSARRAVKADMLTGVSALRPG
ncbi:MAG: hypothetical protein IPP94_11630 [Ignavibacteria bacterium]|nr:hypothetical protein [Ignavibacteria bacterium]